MWKPSQSICHIAQWGSDPPVTHRSGRDQSVTFLAEFQGQEPNTIVKSELRKGLIQRPNSWNHQTAWVAFDSVNWMVNIWTRVENDNSISEQHGMSETIWFTTYDSPTTISFSILRPNLSFKKRESGYVIFWFKILYLNVKIRQTLYN